MDELNPAILARPLPPEAAAAREAFSKINAANRKALASAVQTHLTAYGVALSELEDAHRRVADTTDLELVANTRASAVWLMSGRCIAQARAIQHLLDGGFGNEMGALLRQLHESLRLLEALGAPGEDKLLRKWLAGKNIAPGDAAAAVDRHHNRLRETMARAGVEPIADITSDLNRAYGALSELAHNRRQHVARTVSVEQRVMPVGPHPDVRHGAVALGEAGTFLRMTVSGVGSALALLLGRDWFIHRFNPTFHALDEMARAVPIDAHALGL